MPPKKKLRSSSITTTTNSNSNSNSSKKSTQNQNQNSQPSKYGIQHFFQRHSQPSQPKSLPQNPNLHSKQSHLGENGINGFNTGNTETGRKPDPLVGNPDGRNPNFENPDWKNPKFENPDRENPKGPNLGESGLKGFRRVNGEVGQSENPKKGLDVKGVERVEKIRACESKVSLLVDDVIDCDEVSEVSPDVSKLVPKKRFKFSPGMIIQQSQEDGGEEVTWKISPVNERLQAISKLGPDAVKALARASRLNSSSFEQMSDDTGPHSHCPAANAKGNSVSSSEILEKSPVLSDWSSLKKPREDQCTNVKNMNGSAVDMNNVGSFSSQSPFRTPPSLSHCHDKPVHSAVSGKGLRECHGLRQHKKTLLELLDQVENVISVEGPNVHSSEACNNFANKINPAVPEMAMKTIEEVDLVSRDSFLLVLEVTDKRCSSSADGALCSTRVLRVLNEQRGEEQSVRLWDDWIYSVIEPGDTIRVIGEFDSQGICDVNHEKNLLIIHPDLLLSGTRVAGSFSCPRRAVLDERLKSNEYSVAALVGTLLHQIFQAGLLMENPTVDHLHEFSKIALQKNMESLFACGVQENDMLKTLNEAIPKICKWILLFRHSESSSSPTIDFGLNDGLRKMSISDVVDIEEMAWAPKYGLKGIIDASIRVKLHSNSEVVEKIMPLEFKTGKATSGQSLMEHSAQLILYTLLMSERYLQTIDSGLLYYLSTDQTLGINVRRSDLIGLIMRRNELAHDIIRASMVQQLPPMLQSPNICKGCRHLNSCTTYHKVHGGSAESSGLGDLFDTLTAHLTTTHKVFFKHWDRLIDLEAKELQISKNMSRRSCVSKNESSSSSLSSIVLEASNELHLQTYANDNRFVYRFVHKNKCFSNGRRHNNNLNDDHVPAETDIDCSLRNGDRVILSVESTQVAVARGIVMDICRSHVSVSFSKRLQLPWSTQSLISRDIYQEVWRIEKDEVASSYATMRFNLVQLFLQNECSAHLRKLIVDLEAPRFDSGSILSQDPAISYVWSEKNLNDDQRRAIIKILTAKDYALILGMPGTGKTSTMVYAVKALLMRGASILLTSYTNSAVDNLLIKLKAQGIDFVRIGRYEVLHKEVQGHCLSDMDIHSVEEIKLKMDQVKVVAVTCLGITSPLLANKKFDVCIIDEAGQTSLPVSLGPLMFASTFVLVGDHYQLPPLVKNAEARESGMSVSLFRRLSEQHPQAISPLQNQYRMCADIMSLSNALIYGDRLRCGSYAVENAELQLSTLGSLSSWLKKVLDANKPVIFVNTDVIPAFETKEQKTVVNQIEARIVAELVNALASHGVEKEEIGIITPYNAQANLIQQVLDMTSVEVHTIDKYQGRDKDCILVSFVRSSQNPRNCSSSLLGDWHRINVALTRAKKKLIMIGSCKTLSKVPLLKLLINKVEEQLSVFCITRNDIECKSQLKRCSSSI